MPYTVVSYQKCFISRFNDLICFHTVDRFFQPVDLAAWQHDVSNVLRFYAHAVHCRVLYYFPDLPAKNIRITTVCFIPKRNFDISLFLFAKLDDLFCLRFEMQVSMVFKSTIVKRCTLLKVATVDVRIN